MTASTPCAPGGARTRRRRPTPFLAVLCLAAALPSGGGPAFAQAEGARLLAGTAAERLSEPSPWSVREIVTDRFLFHSPGLGWKPGGSGERPPLPDTVADVATLVLDAERLLEAMAGNGSDPREIEKVAALVIGANSPNDVIGGAHWDTKALLRSGAGGGRELRFHSRYPFHGTYAFAPRDRVEGWRSPNSAFSWPDLFRLRNKPPEREGWQYALHSVALALTSAAPGGDLGHSAYGWWTIAPAALFPERVLCCMGGLSYGVASGPGAAPADGAVWRGRATGHLFVDLRRWALSADMVLRTVKTDAGTAVSGRAENVRVVPLDPETLKPMAAEAAYWGALQFAPARLDGSAWQGGRAAPANGASGRRSKA